MVKPGKLNFGHASMGINKSVMNANLYRVMVIEKAKNRFVTYNNLECSFYDYLPCFNVNVTALLVLLPFYLEYSR